MDLRTLLNLDEYPFHDIDPSELERAFTHHSFDKDFNYEYLEFVGDSVLDTIITDIIITHTPTTSPSELTKLRSYLVSNRFFSELMSEKDLCKYIRTNVKGHKICADVFESIVGVLYLHLIDKRNFGFSSLDYIKEWILSFWNFRIYI